MKISPSEFDQAYEEHLSRYFRAFIRFRATDKGNGDHQATFKRWWFVKGPTSLRMTNDKGKRIDVLPKLKADVWNKYKEVV